MRRAQVLALLAVSALGGCHAPPAVTDGGAMVDAGEADASDAGNTDAGNAAPRDDRLEVFLEAARTNLERPYPANRHESEMLYFNAARSLPGADRRGPAPPGMLVPQVLAQSGDERAARALMAWARVPEARPYLSFILEGMSWQPRAEYLETVKAILADPSLAGELEQSWGNSMSLVLGVEARTSLFAQALDLAMMLPGHEGRELVQRIAADRAASTPNPRTLAALKCPGGTRIEDEAQALASLRIMALCALGDRALWSRIADDLTEPALVRRWVRHLARGRLDRGAPGQASDGETWADRRERDAMPCTRSPAARTPSPRRGPSSPAR